MPFSKIDIRYILRRYFDTFSWAEILIFWVSIPFILAFIFSLVTVSDETYKTLITVFSIAAAFLFNANIVFMNLKDSYMVASYKDENGNQIQYDGTGDPSKYDRTSLIKESLLYLSVTTLLFFVVIALLLITVAINSEAPIIDLFYGEVNITGVIITGTVVKLITIHLMVVVVFNIIFVLKNLYEIFKGAIDNKSSSMKK